MPTSGWLRSIQNFFNRFSLGSLLSLERYTTGSEANRSAKSVNNSAATSPLFPRVRVIRATKTHFSSLLFFVEIIYSPEHQSETHQRTRPLPYRQKTRAILNLS